MWQVEDLIRAFQLNIDEINSRIISSFPVQNETERKTLYEWYESLIEMMRLEDVQQTGHLQLNKNVISELNDFHNLMLKSNQDAGYNAKFYHIIPFINQLRKQNNSNISDIELIFNFQYGILTLRLKKAEISPETLQAQTEISKFMILISKNYKLYKSGELDLDD
jgi:hypothetical protein